jgi:hypothetical protein
VNDGGEQQDARGLDRPVELLREDERQQPGSPNQAPTANGKLKPTAASV